MPRNLLSRVFQEREWPGGLRQKLLDYGRIGLILGGILAVVASVGILIGGPSRVLARLGVTYPVLVLVYLAGGVVTCVMLAILEKFARSLISHVIVGIVVALPAGLLLALVFARPDDSPAALVFAIITWAVSYGTIGGILTWYS